MKKALSVLLVLAALFSASALAAQPAYKKYNHVFFGTFDTVVSLLGYARDKETFDHAARETESAFQRYHMMFDQYHPYEGLNNVYALNRQAAQAPVRVPDELFSLLAYCKQMQPRLRGTVNVAMGSVLALWHEARETAKSDPEHAALPSLSALQQAAMHTSMEDVILDAENKTVFFKDPELKLDVGAVAKGYAAELAAQSLLKGELSHFIINAGGNVRTGNPPLDGRSNWSVGVQDPDANVLTPDGTDVIELLYMHNMSSVTSGDYQRFFTLNGVSYHHLISPETLMPARFMRAVTVLTEDSGLADLLSTALFLMSPEDGMAFLKEFGQPVEALWILNDGSLVMTEGAKKMARSQGADH